MSLLKMYGQNTRGKFSSSKPVNIIEHKVRLAELYGSLKRS